MSTVIGSVTINRNPAYGTTWAASRINQVSVETADGGFAVYDAGVKIIRGVLVLNAVDKTEGDSLRTYLEDTAIFQKNTFTIDPPANTDLGAGAGTAITVNFDGGQSLDGVFELVPPALYNIRIPWRKTV